MPVNPLPLTTRSHDCMATTFTISIACDEPTYASQAINEAFDELDRLERCLSTFIPYSDVSRIARQSAHRSLPIDPATHACLNAAIALERATGGAFNMAYRVRPPRSSFDLIQLDARVSEIVTTSDHVRLDLGGIGKGFALDVIAELLADWELPCFLLRASKSTILAGDAPNGSKGWTIRVGPSDSQRHLELARSAVSGSGTAVRGAHIVNPTTGQPALHHRLAFATARTGAEADALSTAFHVMTTEQVTDFCHRHPSVSYLLIGAQP